MRNLIASVCVVGVLGTGATACGGGEEPARLDIERTAAATAEKGTARITSKVTVQGLGLPLPIDVNATGVTSLTAPEGRLTFDLKPLLGLVGVPASTPGGLEIRFKDDMVYAKPPKVEQLTIPGGKTWVSLELSQLAKAAGLPTEGLGKLFTLEPAAQLRALKAAKGLEEVGQEEVGGADTTHYRGTFKLSDLAATLPADEQAEVAKAVDRLDQLGGGASTGLDDPLPADLWIDEDGVTRKLLSTSKLPAQGGQPAATIKQSYELSDFGAALDAGPPPAADIYDATRAAAAGLEQATAGAGSTAP